MGPIEQFVESWLLENYHFEGYPPPEGAADQQARQLAAGCVQAALAEGISQQEIEEALGSLESYIHRRIEGFADEYAHQHDKDC